MLPPPLRQRFISALLAVPKVRDRNRRDELLSNLPQNLVDGLNRDDTPRTDLTLIVGQLDPLGRLTATGERPLINIAEAALPYLEGTEAGRTLKETIEQLEDHYGLGEAHATMLKVALPLPPTVDVRIPEAIIFSDQRVSYEFIARALAVSVSVARLMVPRYVGGEWRGPPVLGTGWVVAPGLLITNHHVVAARFDGETEATSEECRLQAASARAWFDYWVEGGTRDERVFAELVYTNADLDYAVLRLKDGSGRKPLTIASEPPFLAKGDRLNIVQHPGGGAQKYAIRSNHYVETAEGHLLRYLTDTEPGSSGSPVFDDEWQVIALHRAAVYVPKQHHGKGVVYVNNEGVAIQAILADLPSVLRGEIVRAQECGGDAAHE